MKGKTTIGADILCDKYQRVPEYSDWDWFHHVSVNAKDELPRVVKVNNKLYYLVQQTEEK